MRPRKFFGILFFLILRKTRKDLSSLPRLVFLVICLVYAISHPRSLAEFFTGTGWPDMVTSRRPFRSSQEVPHSQDLLGASFIPRQCTNLSSICTTFWRVWIAWVITAQLSANMDTWTVGQTRCMTLAARTVSATMHDTLAAHPSGMPQVLGTTSPIWPAISICRFKWFSMARCADMYSSGIPSRDNNCFKGHRGTRLKHFCRSITSPHLWSFVLCAKSMISPTHALRASALSFDAIPPTWGGTCRPRNSKTWRLRNLLQSLYSTLKIVIGRIPNGRCTDSPGLASIATLARVSRWGQFIPPSTALYRQKSHSRRTSGILFTSNIEKPQAPLELRRLTPFIIFFHSSMQNGL